MHTGIYNLLPPENALRWFKIVAGYRVATGQGEAPGFELPPDHRLLHAGSGQDAFQILIVDDQELLRDVVGEYLGMQGYQVHAAESGSAGLRLLQSGLRPELLLCDVLLPDGSGKGFVREAQLLVPDLKVLFMSGHFREAIAAEIGEAEFLQKPFRLDVLARRIRSLLAGEHPH
jgi:DNA-binding NtrC family response regulator